jgi:hypothetical protein
LAPKAGSKVKETRLLPSTLIVSGFALVIAEPKGSPSLRMPLSFSFLAKRVASFWLKESFVTLTSLPKPWRVTARFWAVAIFNCPPPALAEKGERFWVVFSFGAEAQSAFVFDRALGVGRIEFAAGDREGDGGALELEAGEARSGAPGGESWAPSTYPEMGPRIDRVRTPEGDVVVMTAVSWAHIVSEHPEMTIYREEILETVASPHVMLADPEFKRKRFYRSGVGPSRWLRVIVDFRQRPARIVTAFGFRKEHPA